MVTAQCHGIAMHSAYDPRKEAVRDVATSIEKATRSSVLVQLGFGLGYHALAAVAACPALPLIIVEPSLRRIITAMQNVDLSPLFAHPNLMLCPGSNTAAVIALLEQQGITNCLFITKPSLQTHCPGFFSGLWNLIQRNKDKYNTNRRTLQKFSGLWFRNMCRNTDQLAYCDGITRFRNCLGGTIPAVVVAAGPTLDTRIELLQQLQHTCFIICVDTALRALLRHNITPHCIILCDPQYYNARHIEGLSAPDSILVTESAAYPSVFRFNCREIVLCSSMFPLGAYIERQIGSKGALGTGGSVSASAWDFARYCGASEILLLGLDLGFPQKKTHTKGSTFEEKTFSVSTRTNPAETLLTNVLYGPLTLKKTDYTGRELLSDRRMELYAWWFESKCVEFPEVRTFTASSSSLAIPGIVPATPDDLARFLNPEKTFDTSLLSSPPDAESCRKQRIQDLQQALAKLVADLHELKQAITRADRACTSHATTLQDQQKVLAVLDETDRTLLHSPVKELLSLIFPDQENLQHEYAAISVPEEPAALKEWRISMAQSHILYTHVLAAINRWLKNFS